MSVGLQKVDIFKDLLVMNQENFKSISKVDSASHPIGRIYVVLYVS